MPILTLQCARHPNKQQTERLMEKLTAVIAEELSVPSDVVHVIISKVDPELWGVAGKPLSEKFSGQSEG